MCFSVINANLGLEQWLLENWSSINGSFSASWVSFLSWSGPTVMIDMVVNSDKKLFCVLILFPVFFKMKKNLLCLSFLKSCRFIWVVKWRTISSLWDCGKGGGSSLYPAPSIFLVIPFVLSLHNLRISKHMYFQLLLKGALYCFFSSFLSHCCARSQNPSVYCNLMVCWRFCVRYV